MREKLYITTTISFLLTKKEKIVCHNTLEKPTVYKKAATGNRKSMVQVSQGRLVTAIGVKRKPSSRHTGVSDLVLQNIQRKKKATDDSFLHYLVSFTLFKNTCHVLVSKV